MNNLKKHPLVLGTIVPLFFFLFLGSLANLLDDRTFSYVAEKPASIGAAQTSATKMPTNSFVQLQQSFVDSITRKETPISLGSGIVIKTTHKGSYILTNNHVCNISIRTIMAMASRGHVGSLKNSVKALNGEKADVLTLKKDARTDMCMVFAKNFFRPAVKIAPRGPKIGESIFVVGAPRGYYAPNFSTVPIFSGIFSGFDEHWADKNIMVSVLSIRIAPGNSGSGIFDENGDLVGVIHSHMTEFDEISWGTTYGDTKDFIRTYISLK